MKPLKKVNVSNLRLHENITVFGKTSHKKSGYDGHPMKFLALTGNHIHVAVDLYRQNEYGFITTYDWNDFEVVRFPKNVLKEIEKKNKL